MNQLPTPAKPLYIQSFKTDDHIAYLWKMIDGLRRNVDSLAGRSIDGTNVVVQSITRRELVPGSDTTAFHTQGDSFGADAYLGTNDAYDLYIERGGTTVASFTAARLRLVPTFYLYLGATGNLLPNTAPWTGNDYIAITDSVVGRIAIGLYNTNAGTDVIQQFYAMNTSGNALSLRLNGVNHTGAGLVNTAGAGGVYMGEATASPARNKPLIISNQYNDANSPIIFGIADAEAARFAATTGYLGAGTSTPRRRGDFFDSAGNPQLRLTFTDNTQFVDLRSDGASRFYISAIESRLLHTGTAAFYSVYSTGSVLTEQLGHINTNTRLLVGANTTGVSLIAAFPTIGFNLYYDAAAATYKRIGAGYSWAISGNMTTGSLQFQTVGTSGAAGASITTSNVITVGADGHTNWAMSDALTTPFIDLIQSSTGDAAYRCTLGTTISYAFGIDNSVSGDPFVLSTAASGSAALGTGNILSITSGGLATWSRSDSATTPTQDMIQSSTGDAATRWALSTTISYILGIDNSVSGDPFVLATAASGSAALGTGNLWSITALGYSTWSVSDSATTPFHDLIQSSTGDSALRFAISTTNSWAIGADNSDSDKFKVSWAGSGSAALGTNDYITVTVGGFVGIGQATPLTPLHVGAGSTTGTDVALLVCRTLSSGAGNAHAYDDETTISRSGTVAYNSYDCNASTSGSNNFDHISCFQGRASHTSSGTLANYYAFITAPATSGGVISSLYHFYATDPTGAGTITTQYGFYIGSFAKAGTNWGIWVNDTPSFFGCTTNFQIRSGYNTSIYTDLKTDSAGDFNITPTGDELILTKSITTGLYFECINANTANSTADAIFWAQVGGASAGDPFTIYRINGVINWSVGVDNSDSDKFKVSKNIALGTNDYFTIDTSGVVGFGVHSAIGAEALSGYMVVNDQGGTPRKLAVVS